MASYKAEIQVVAKGLKGVDKLAESVKRLNKAVQKSSKLKESKTDSFAQQLKKQNNLLKTQIADQRQLNSLLEQESKLRRSSAKTAQASRPRGGGGLGGGGGRLSQAILGGGFPLLFGGGPAQALGGLVGGAAGGFAGGIAGQLIVGQFEAIGRAAADLGNALDPLTFDLEAVSTAAGVAGTETAQFLEKIEKYGSATEAARLATALLEIKIGKDGVQALRDFGDSATTLGNALSTIFTQVLANIAKVAGPLLESLAKFAGEQADVGAFLGKTGLTGREKLAQEILGTSFQTRQGELTTASSRALSGFSARSRALGGEGFQTAEQARAFATGIASSFERELKVPLLQEIKSVAAGVQTPEEKRAAAAAARPKEQQEAKAARLLQLAKDRSRLAEAMTAQEKRSIQLVIQKEKVDRELNLLSKEKRDAIKDELENTFLITNITETRKEQEKALADAAERRRKAEEEAAKKLQSIYDQLGKTIAQGVVGSIQAAVDGTKSLAEVASNTLRNLANQLLTLGVNTLLKSTGAGIFSNLLGFANGGRPPVGRPSVVGERGPELFVPRTSGTIVPNHALGGSANVTVNVDASGSSVQGDGPSANQLGKAIGAAVQAELIKQKRPGGLLTR